jgi:hemerythrin
MTQPEERPMPDLITWEPAMSVGVAILDEDHRRIMKLINKLHDAMVQGQGRDVLGDIFHGLMVYISLHFEAEEDMFVLTDYPGLAEQRQQHKEMASKAASFKMNFEENRDSVMPMEVLYFLKDWWIDHIMNADRKYAAHLNAHGIR